MSICYAGVNPSLQHAGFEASARRSWQGPWGGGIEGGQGGVAFVVSGAVDFVRSGKTSARLDVWDDGRPSAMAWSCLRQRVRCSPGTYAKAAVWIYHSSAVAPLAATGATAQLRIEYFSDDDGEQLIPTQVVLSPPFGPLHGYARDEWHRIEVSDHVPREARCLGLSVVFMAQNPGTSIQSIWVDDVELDLASRNRANQPVPRGKAEPSDFPWWKQLFGP